MPERADAHIHLFQQTPQTKDAAPRGFFTSRPGVHIDELACYESLAADHHVTAALVVGYEGGDWCRDNNRFIAEKCASHDWLYPVAFAAEPDQLTVAKLEAWQQHGFAGISLYLLDENQTKLLGLAPDEVWEWLISNRWLVSVNSRWPYWEAWLPILSKHETLRVLLSHLGLPPAVSEPPTQQQSQQALAGPLGLAKFPGPRVKLSGFYAVTTPRHDYPHTAAWPYVECLRSAFGVERLLWASDYPPCLDSLSYPQTLSLFPKMPFLSASDCEQIEGGNLHRLLAEVK